MIRTFAAHPTAANLLLLLFLGVGLLAAPGLKRETFPDFSTDTVQVRIVYPGATAEEVEEAICQRIEDAVDGLNALDEVRCEARESLASATLEMDPEGEVNRFLIDVKTEIDAVDEFPELAEDPIISQINIMDQVVSLAITGPMEEPAAHFTTTADLNAEFPAVAARQMGWEYVALMCGHEMSVADAARKCIRVLLLVNTEKAPEELQFVYLKGAKDLRKRGTEEV